MPYRRYVATSALTLLRVSESFNVVVVSFAKRRNNESLVQINSAIDVCRTTESQMIVHGIARLVFEGTPVEPMATHESDRRNCLRKGVGDQNRAGKADRQRQDAVTKRCGPFPYPHFR